MRVAEKIWMLRNHGRREKYVHELLGYNMRFNEIQAAIGLKQLEKLQGWIETRRNIAEKYNNALRELMVTPNEKEWARHVYYMYVIWTERRDPLREFLKTQGVSTGIHYPIPIHRQPVISRYTDQKPVLKNTERACQSVLSLPMHPQLHNSEIEYICERIADFCQEREIRIKL